MIKTPFHTVIFSAVLFVATICCGGGDGPDRDPDAGNGTDPGGLAGSTWEADGFGYVLTVDTELGGELHEVLPPLGSIKTLAAKIENDSLIATESNGFVEVGEIVASVTLEDDHLLVKREGTLDNIIFRRLDERPAILDQAPATDPASVVDYFCRTFEAHHAFLQRRIDEVAVVEGNAPPGTTWQAACAVARANVSSDTSRSDLCLTMAKLLVALGDSHTFLFDPLDATETCDVDGIHPRTFATMRPGIAVEDIDFASIELDIGRGFAIVEAQHLEEPSTSIANGEITYGIIRGEPVLYVRILSFSDFVDDGSFADELTALEAGLDELAALYATRGLTSVVFDLRFNGGGSDKLGIAIAERLNQTTYVAYVERARNDPDVAGAFSPGQTMQVETNDRAGMRGANVALLTGPLSVSAAETFAMALLGRSNSVIRVGEATQGVFSDVHVRLMPNLMVVGLPNEAYLTETGADFAIGGVQPTHPQRVFAPEDLANQIDPALERAVMLLGAL